MCPRWEHCPKSQEDYELHLAAGVFFVNACLHRRDPFVEVLKAMRSYGDWPQASDQLGAEVNEQVSAGYLERQRAHPPVVRTHDGHVTIDRENDPAEAGRGSKHGACEVTARGRRAREHRRRDDEHTIRHVATSSALGVDRPPVGRARWTEAAKRA